MGISIILLLKHYRKGKKCTQFLSERILWLSVLISVPTDVSTLNLCSGFSRRMKCDRRAELTGEELGSKFIVLGKCTDTEQQQSYGNLHLSGSTECSQDVWEDWGGIWKKLRKYEPSARESPAGYICAWAYPWGSGHTSKTACLTVFESRISKQHSQFLTPT